MFKRSADRRAVKREVNRAVAKAAPIRAKAPVPQDFIAEENEAYGNEEIPQGPTSTFVDLAINEDGHDENIGSPEDRVVDFSDAQTAVIKRAPAQPRQPKSFDEISKNDFGRLLKAANVLSASADVLDAAKELIPDFVGRALKSVTSESDRAITTSKIDNLVQRFLTNGEADVVENISLPTAQLEKLIRPIFMENGYTIKKDGMYLLHHFVESFLIKALQCADIIAEAGKRTRICGRDLSVAYTVRML